MIVTSIVFRHISQEMEVRVADPIMTMRTWQPGLCADLEHLEGSQDIRREVRAGHTVFRVDWKLETWSHGRD